MTEVYRGPWGPPRISVEPRALIDGGDLHYLLEHCDDLLGTKVVMDEVPDPVSGRRVNVGWLDEDGRQVAYLTGDVRFVSATLEELARRTEQASGVAVDRPATGW